MCDEYGSNMDYAPIVGVSVWTWEGRWARLVRGLLHLPPRPRRGGGYGRRLQRRFEAWEEDQRLRLEGPTREAEEAQEEEPEEP